MSRPRSFASRSSKISTLGPGPLEVKDMFDHTIMVGDVLHMILDKELKRIAPLVTDIQPVIDPTMPKDLIRVQLQVSFPLLIKRGEAMENASIGKTQEETGWTREEEKA